METLLTPEAVAAVVKESVPDADSAGEETNTEDPEVAIADRRTVWLLSESGPAATSVTNIAKEYSDERAMTVMDRFEIRKDGGWLTCWTEISTDTGADVLTLGEMPPPSSTSVTRQAQVP